MGQFSARGLYAKYDKNNKERDKLDYYSTPTEEVVNILEKINLDFTDKTILEPSCGGGHMIEGILPFAQDCKEIIGTDIRDRGYNSNNSKLKLEYNLDFLSDDYPYSDDIDYIIMNPPYKTIEGFTLRALEIAQKGILMLARLQFLEGQGRFENIFLTNPPTKFWTYVDRIACFKNGDITMKPDSIQAYAWFYWDKTKDYEGTAADWIRRYNKR